MTSNVTPEIVAALVSFIFAMIATPLVITICKSLGIYDRPNARKMHKVAIPRLGGIVFLPSMMVGILVGFTFLLGGIHESITLKLPSVGMILGALIIYLIGVLDDLHEIKAIYKFYIQLIVALIFPFCNLLINDLHGFLGIYLLPIYISYPLTVFVILLVVNAMNLIDGIDGLSSGLSILILGAFGFLYKDLNALPFSVISVSLMGAVLAFFIFNMFGKVGGKKVFMGDSGSLFLGYVIVYLAIKYQMNNGDIFPYREDAFMISYTLLFIPTIDLVRVALSRLYNRKSIFAPDKTHIHHLIMQAGASMHWALAIILILFVVFCSINYGLNSFRLDQTYILLTDIVIYCAFIASISKLKSV